MPGKFGPCKKADLGTWNLALLLLVSPRSCKRAFWLPASLTNCGLAKRPFDYKVLEK